MWDLWCTKWQWKKFYSQYCIFPCESWFRQSVIYLLVPRQYAPGPSRQCYVITDSVLGLGLAGLRVKSLCIFFIILSGVRLSPLGTAATTFLLYQPQMIDDGDCGAIGGNRSTRRKPAQRHFVHHKSHMTRPGLEPGPPQWEASDKPPELWRGWVEGLIEHMQSFCILSFQYILSGMTLTA
jgi:hypothetical protein